MFHKALDTFSENTRTNGASRSVDAVIKTELGKEENPVRFVGRRKFRATDSQDDVEMKRLKFDAK